MIILDANIVNMALPSIQSDLHFSQSSLAWVVNAYLIAFGGLLLLAGRLGDLIGRKRIFMIGLTVFTSASLLFGLTPSQRDRRADVDFRLRLPPPDGRGHRRGHGGCRGILLGRTTYEMFEPSWSTRTVEDDPGAPFFNDTTKYVVSATLTTATWRNWKIIGPYDPTRSAA